MSGDYTAHVDEAIACAIPEFVQVRSNVVIHGGALANPAAQGQTRNTRVLASWGGSNRTDGDAGPLSRNELRRNERTVMTPSTASDVLAPYGLQPAVRAVSRHSYDAARTRALKALARRCGSGPADREGTS